LSPRGAQRFHAPRVTANGLHAGGARACRDPGGTSLAAIPVMATMTARRWLGPIGVFGVWLAAGACASAPPRSEPPQQGQLARAIAAPPRLLPAEPLPATARVLLKSRMANHAHDMSALMSSIMVLDYPAIREGADAVASDANLSRPITGDATELNSALPASFFDYQDRLRGDARKLSASAERMAPFDVADAYGRLSESCVRCHAVYRAGR
jgi:cytochrome c556